MRLLRNFVDWKALSPYLWASFYGFLIYIIFSIILSNMWTSLLIFTFIALALFVVLTIIGFVKRRKGENHFYFEI
jgi:membrane protein DedA with SNARE-associated domain